MHCHTTCGQWAVELLQCTASLPGGSGQCNSCNALPHCLGAVGSGTPAPHCHTSLEQWAVELMSCTATLLVGSGQCNSYNALPHRLGPVGSGAPAMRGLTSWGAVVWCDVVWCGVVWCGVLCCAVMCYLHCCHTVFFGSPQPLLPPPFPPPTTVQDASPHVSPHLPSCLAPTALIPQVQYRRPAQDPQPGLERGSPAAVRAQPRGPGRV